MEEKTRQKPNKLKQFETVKLSDLLRKHCTTVNGFAVYEEGWNDQRIVKELEAQFKINETNVGNLRRVMIGVFPPSEKTGGKASNVELIRRLEAAEKELNALAGYYDKMEKAYNDVLVLVKRMADWSSKRPRDPFVYRRSA